MIGIFSCIFSLPVYILVNSSEETILPNDPFLNHTDIPWLNDFVIEDIFPVGEIHLIAGASGAGKTTWLIKLIESWMHGNSVFGHKSHSRPFVYISGDRSDAGIRRTFNRVGVDYKKIPIYSLKPADRTLSFVDVLKKLKAIQPDLEVFFVEGIAARVPNGKLNDYNIVSNFLLDLQDFCAQNGATVIGVIHTAKTKEGESYQDPRQKALGSVGWAGYSETIVLVETTEADRPDLQTRRITILPRNFKAEIFQLEFGAEGHLVEIKKPEAVSPGTWEKIKKQ